jgi:hypothetical protein
VLLANRGQHSRELKIQHLLQKLLGGGGVQNYVKEERQKNYFISGSGDLILKI